MSGIYIGDEPRFRTPVGRFSPESPGISRSPNRGFSMDPDYPYIEDPEQDDPLMTMMVDPGQQKVVSMPSLEDEDEFDEDYEDPEIVRRPRVRSPLRETPRGRIRSPSGAPLRTRSFSRSRSRSRAKSRTIRRRPDDLNPITLEPYSRNYYKLQEQVREYPASQPDVKRKLFKLLDETDIVLLSGDTGSGKTTQVPRLVWEYLDFASTVVCTQPRTLTASRVAARVAEELDVEFGRHVGFRFRGSEEEKGGDIFGPAILVYLTEGTFLNNLFKDPTALSSYGAVIIDEAHDRTIDVDLLMFYIRETLSLPGLRTKFIIMSATLDKDTFMGYFKEHDMKYMHITGRTFDVDSRFLTKSIYSSVIKSGNAGMVYKAAGEMINTILDDIMSNNDKKKQGDVLVFMPTINSILNLKRRLEQHFERKNYGNYEVMALSSETPEEQRGPITTPIPGKIKVILSTNIAETGVSIGGIYYVIETGLSFQPEYNMIDRVTTLDLNFISKAEVKQRKGRAGRMKPGMCFHLYTTEEYKKFIGFRKPEIYRSNYDDKLLRLFFQFKNTYNGHQYVKEVIDMLISPPEKKGLEATLKYFRKLKLISNELEKDRITDLGECFTGMDLDIDMTKLFLTGTAYEIEPEIWADIISILVIKSNIKAWFTVRELPENFKEKYMNKYGDIIGLYHIYLDYKEKNLPKDYVDMLDLRLFDKIQDMSDSLLDNSVAGSLFCTDAIQPKKKIGKDMYQNMVNAFNQALSDQIIPVTKLDMRRTGFSFIDLEKEKEVLALSRVILRSFGEKPIYAYDNFVRLT